MSSAFSEPSAFRSVEETAPTRRATREPETMIDYKSHVDPKRECLTGTVSDSATSELINKDFLNLAFPRTMKFFIDPPLNGQHIALISFIPSKKATPDPDGCYGVVKVRGAFHDAADADQRSEAIIRDHDSYAIIDYCYVGKPFPLMKDNSVYRQSTREIDIRRKVDEVQKDEIKRQREIERSETESVQQRHRDLMRDVSEDKEKAVDDLEFYTQLRVKKASLIHHAKELERKITDSQELVVKANQEIQEMDKKHPEYRNEFLERYKQALAASGIAESSNPLLQYMMDNNEMARLKESSSSSSK